MDLNKSLYTQKIEYLSLKNQNTSAPKIDEEALKKEMEKRWLMVLGEGAVFMIFLILGIVKTNKAFRAEISLTRQQKNFLLSITHEFKSPLSSIKLYLQTLQKRDLDKEKQSVFIKNAINDTERLNQLVENALLATQIENNNYTFRKENVSLSNFIKEILTINYNLLFNFEKKIDFQTHIESDIFYCIDKLAFSSVLINLMENAIKYSDEEVKLTVELKKVDKNILLRFIDEGMGISDHEKDKIFKKFYRSGDERTRRTKGTGLGLYIVSNVVEHHNGKILVKDNKPKGSIFEIWLDSEHNECE